MITAMEPARAGAVPVRGVRVYAFRSQEDASAPPDPAVVARAPFEANLRLGAVLWQHPARPDGRVPAEHGIRLGTATACACVRDATFAEGSRAPFYAVFDLPEGRVTAVGECTVVTNDVPVPGLVMAAASLRVVEAPAGFSGGVATSLSVFNPASLEGFNTGSFWTIQLYETALGAALDAAA